MTALASGITLTAAQADLIRGILEREQDRLELAPSPRLSTYYMRMADIRNALAALNGPCDCSGRKHVCERFRGVLVIFRED